MAIKVSTKYVILAILIVFLGTFVGGWMVGSKKAQNSLQLAQNALKDTIERLTVQINDTEYQLTKTEQELVTEKQLRKQDIIDKETLKAINVKHVTEISKLKLRIDTLLEDVSHNGQIIPIDTIFVDNKPQNAILLPFSFEKKDKWLNLRGDFNSKGALNISLKLDSIDVDVITGVTKKGERTVNILTDNTYIGTIGVRSYKTDVEKPKRWSIGPSIGYAITKNSLSPYIGIGLSYNVIRF